MSITVSCENWIYFYLIFLTINLLQLSSVGSSDGANYTRRVDSQDQISDIVEKTDRLTLQVHSTVELDASQDESYRFLCGISDTISSSQSVSSVPRSREYRAFFCPHVVKDILNDVSQMPFITTKKSDDDSVRSLIDGDSDSNVLSPSVQYRDVLLILRHVGKTLSKRRSGTVQIVTLIRIYSQKLPTTFFRFN